MNKLHYYSEFLSTIGLVDPINTLRDPVGWGPTNHMMHKNLGIDEFVILRFLLVKT